jgi:hypothetical protein
MSSAANKARIAAWTQNQIAKAVSFTAVMYRGFPEGPDVRRADTLEGARALKVQMLAEYEGKNYGRGVMIYAVTKTDMTIHVE